MYRPGSLLFPLHSFQKSDCPSRTVQPASRSTKFRFGDTFSYIRASSFLTSYFLISVILSANYASCQKEPPPIRAKVPYYSLYHLIASGLCLHFICIHAPIFPLTQELTSEPTTSFSLQLRSDIHNSHTDIRLPPSPTLLRVLKMLLSPSMPFMVLIIFTKSVTPYNKVIYLSRQFPFSSGCSSCSTAANRRSCSSGFTRLSEIGLPFLSTKQCLLFPVVLSSPVFLSRTS